MTEEIVGYVGASHRDDDWIGHYCRRCMRVHRVMLPQAAPQALPETPLWWDVGMALGVLFVDAVLFVAWGPLAWLAVTGMAGGLVFWLGRRHGR